MLVDNHIHLYDASFDADRDDAVRRAREVGVEAFVVPAIDVRTTESALRLAAVHNDVHPMAGIHPSEVKDATEDDFLAIERLSENPGVVAIGETGLDYYWDRSFDDRQQDFLRRHVRLAMRAGLPLVLHNREGGDDIVRILREERDRSSDADRLRGVFHCFSGPAELIDDVNELGFYFGIGGLVTFKNAGVAELVGRLPANRILLETDAPYLAPVPKRGKRNEPSYLAHIARRVSDALEWSMEELIAVTGANSVRLFRLGVPGGTAGNGWSQSDSDVTP